MPRFRSVALMVFAAAAVQAQQPAFTTRVSIDSPVTVASFTESKVYGYESVTIYNLGADAVAAVRLVVTFQAGTGDEIVEERRFPVEISPHTSRRVVVDLGHKEGLRQKMRPGPDSQALAILSVNTVEFSNGSAWQSGVALPQLIDPPDTTFRKK